MRRSLFRSSRISVASTYRSLLSVSVCRLLAQGSCKSLACAGLIRLSHTRKCANVPVWSWQGNELGRDAADALIQAMARLCDASPVSAHVAHASSTGSACTAGQAQSRAARRRGRAGADAGHVSRKGHGGGKGWKEERTQRQGVARRLLDMSHAAPRPALGLQHKRALIASAPPDLAVVL